jgi:hypothetical protein
MTDHAATDEPDIANIGPLAPAGQATWEAIAQLATHVRFNRWAVVGGQMVAIHGALAGVEPPRVTDDGDVVVDVRSFGRNAMLQVASTLTSIGFESHESPEGVTRFQRDRAKIDLLAPEGIGENVKTVPPGHAIQAPGASQALDRTIPVTVDWGDGRVVVRCPSLLGAIIAKSAASKEIVSLTNDERLKHQLDLVFLITLAALRPADALDAWTADMGKKDRQRLKAATSPILGDDTHRARTASNMDDVAAAIDVLLRR